MNLGEGIRQARLDMGLSQEALARELHVGFTSVNRWENGHTKPNQIARHVLIELCKSYNIDSDIITIIEKSR